MTMQTVVNVSCDGQDCDHVRASDSNHWLVGVVLGKSVIIATTRDKLPSNNTQRNQFIPEEVKDFCGEQCAIKWVSSKLTEIKNDK